MILLAEPEMGVDLNLILRKAPGTTMVGRHVIDYPFGTGTQGLVKVLEQ